MPNDDAKKRLAGNPEMHQAAQKLIMACAAFHKHFDKPGAKGWLSSKTYLQTADEEIRRQLTVMAILAKDIVAGPGMVPLINEEEAIHSYIISYLADFRKVYPNWQDAYEVLDSMFEKK